MRKSFLFFWNNDKLQNWSMGLDLMYQFSFNDKLQIWRVRFCYNKLQKSHNPSLFSVPSSSLTFTLFLSPNQPLPLFVIDFPLSLLLGNKLNSHIYERQIRRKVTYKRQSHDIKILHSSRICLHRWSCYVFYYIKEKI